MRGKRELGEEGGNGKQGMKGREWGGERKEGKGPQRVD